MNKIFFIIFIFCFETSLCQTISIKKLEKCISEYNTNIEAICILNKFQFLLNDTTTSSKFYKYSENNFDDVASGQKVIQFSSKEEKVFFISYSTIYKSEYFEWLEYLKNKKYKKMKSQSIETVKKEWYLLKNIGIQIITEQVKTTDNKMTVFKYTIKMADGNMN